MRELRILFGPAATVLIVLSPWNWAYILKLFALGVGICFIPQKDQYYERNRRNHGIAMKVVSGLVVLELLLGLKSSSFAGGLMTTDILLS